MNYVFMLTLLGNVIAAIGFNISTYTVNEGESITLTIVLNTTVTSEISFDLVTEDGSANGKQLATWNVKLHSQSCLSFSLSPSMH